MREKQILVTGGSGFLGSHLCKKLLDEGNYVISIDNYDTGSPENIRALLTNPRFEAIRHDINTPIYLQVDEIYNLACPASPIHYQADPIGTVKTNFIGSMNMLGLAKRVNAKILQTSTSEVYGNPDIHPQVEEYNGNVNPIGIRACYDEGKRVAETLFFDYQRKHGVDIRVARLFNTYGPKMSENDGRVVSNFIVQALKGQDITIYGDGSQTRSFCYVDDMIDALIRLMKSNYKKPINLGNPSERTVLELAEKIVDLTNSKSKIIFKELPEDDPIKRKPSIEKAKRELGWEPSTDIDEGLRRTIGYFKEYI